MVVLARETCIQNITSKLAYIEGYIRLSDSVNRYDINIAMENFSMELLNLVYDYELINANAERKNAPGVDLLDRENRVAVQVTSNTTSEKIRHSIDEFLQKELDKEYDQLIVFMMQPKKSYTAQFETKNRFEFDRDRDVIDFSTIMKEIADRASDAKVRKISRFFDSSVESVFPEKGTTITPIEKYITKQPTESRLYGRDIQLDSLEKMIKDHHALVLVNGLGGIGKTALARSLFHRLEDQYQHIGWIEYSDDLKKSLLTGLTIKRFCNIEDVEERFEAIMDYFRNDSESLLLFIDDVTRNSLEDKTLEELAAQKHISLILTSRRTDMEYFQPVTVGFLGEEDCANLFFHHCACSSKEEDLQLIKEMIEWAHYHTLTIELLAKASKDMGVRRFYQKLMKDGLHASTRKVSSAHTPDEKTILEHMKILFNLAEFGKESEEYRFLSNLAMMPTIDIPSDIEEWLSADPNVVRRLIQRGWVEAHDGYYFMHALIKEVLKEDLVPVMDQAFASYVKEGMYFDEDLSPADLQIRISILSYYLEYVPDAEQSIYEILISNIWNQGDYLYNLRDISNSKAFFERMLKIAERMTKHHSSHRAERFLSVSYNKLGDLLSAEGNLSKAKEYYEKALELSEKLCEETQTVEAIRDLSVSYNKLGDLLRAEGNLSKAKEYYEKDLELSEKLCEETGTMQSFDDLAVSYYKLGTLGSRKHMEQALQIYELLTERCPSVKRYRTNRDIIHKQLRDMDGKSSGKQDRARKKWFSFWKR